MGVYDERLERVRTEMENTGLGALLVVPGASMRYLTGFSEEGHERLLCLVVYRERAPLFITPALNAEQVRRNPAGITDVRVWNDSEGWETLTRPICLDENLHPNAIGIDEAMPARFLLPLQLVSPKSQWVSAGRLFTKLRSVKDAAELELLARAAKTTDATIALAYEACKPGATEKDVSRAILDAIHSQGSELSFPPIIGSGPNGALPHHHTGDRVLTRGDVLVLDFGAQHAGYYGDITRTVCLGEPPPEAKRVYDVVLQAQQAAIKWARPGVTAAAVDAAARNVIDDAGYGEYFIHRTGHGIGLEDHEAPNIVSNNTVELQPGMCFSIEPGVYLPGQFGVRLEIIARVTEDGCASFNRPNEPHLTDIG